MIKHGICKMDYFHSLLPVLEHWAVAAALIGVVIPAKPAKAAAADKPNANSCAYVGAGLSILVRATELRN